MSDVVPRVLLAEGDGGHGAAEHPVVATTTAPPNACDRLEATRAQVELIAAGQVLVSKYLPPRPRSWPLEQDLVFDHALCVNSGDDHTNPERATYQVHSAPKALTVAELSDYRENTHVCEEHHNQCAGSERFNYPGMLQDGTIALLFSSRASDPSPAVNLVAGCDHWEAAWRSATAASPIASPPHCDKPLTFATASTASACGASPSRVSPSTIFKLALSTRRASGGWPVRLHASAMPANAGVTCIKVTSSAYHDGFGFLTSYPPTEYAHASLNSMAGGNVTLTGTGAAGHHLVEVFGYLPVGTITPPVISMVESGKGTTLEAACAAGVASL